MKNAKLEFYSKSKLIGFKLVKQWRWKLTASNGKVLCASSEGFFNRVDCVSNAKKTGWALVELVKRNVEE